ncbi:hypothetical protein FB45DRAFT_931776 [Roridomyces roridus]|uniref:Uncharacterized protein n=1 Tax=Roridomyces roridus TaxID=1738132 RepID=A0AAD7BDX9_9AGAR|nr:hypothetical protein FB45DRAFT_931776 [Roridomyces roridus]
MLLSSTIAAGLLLSLVQSAFAAPRGDGLSKWPRLLSQFPAQYSRGEDWQALVDPAAGTGRTSASPAGEVENTSTGVVYNLYSEAEGSGPEFPSHSGLNGGVLVLTVVLCACSVFGAFALVVAVTLSLVCNQRRQYQRNGIHELQDMRTPNPAQPYPSRQPEMTASTSTITLVPRAYSVPGRSLLI